MHLLIAGGRRADRLSAAAAREQDYPRHTRLVLDSATLPFIRIERLELSPPPRLVRIDDIELAFPNHQSGGVRLVLTQSTYLLQKLIDHLGPDDVIVATADLAALERGAGEALAHRGVWRVFEDASVPATDDAPQIVGMPGSEASAPFAPAVAAAFASRSPGERHELCRRAAAENQRS